MCAAPDEGAAQAARRMQGAGRNMSSEYSAAPRPQAPLLILSAARQTATKAASGALYLLPDYYASGPRLGPVASRRQHSSATHQRFSHEGLFVSLHCRQETEDTGY